MLNINIVFLEEYKRLDSLLKDFSEGDEAGVTKYINQMDITPMDKQLLVESWYYDYKTLKHLRWVRNKLAHDEGSLDEELCTEDDINWLKGFYQRILNKDDPFSIIEEKSKPKKAEKPKKEKKGKEKPVKVKKEKPVKIKKEKPKKEKKVKIKKEKKPKIKKVKEKPMPKPKAEIKGESLGERLGSFFKNILKL